MSVHNTSPLQHATRRSPQKIGISTIVAPLRARTFRSMKSRASRFWRDGRGIPLKWDSPLVEVSSQENLIGTKRVHNQTVGAPGLQGWNSRGFRAQGAPLPSLASDSLFTGHAGVGLSGDLGRNSLRRSCLSPPRRGRRCRRGVQSRVNVAGISRFGQAAMTAGAGLQFQGSNSSRRLTV